MLFNLRALFFTDHMSSYLYTTLSVYDVLIIKSDALNTCHEGGHAKYRSERQNKTNFRF